MEKNLLRVGIAHQLDGHGSIAGDETLADQLAGRDAAKAPLRHNLRGGSVPPTAWVRSDTIARAPAAWAGTDPLARGEDIQPDDCLSAVRPAVLRMHSVRQRASATMRESTHQSGSGRACLQKISALHRFLFWSDCSTRPSSDPVDPIQRVALSELQMNLHRFSFRQVQIAGGLAGLRLRPPKLPERRKPTSMPCRAISVTSCFPRRSDRQIHGPGIHVPGQFVKPRKGAEQHPVHRALHQRRRKRRKHLDDTGARVGQHFHHDQWESRLAHPAWAWRRDRENSEALGRRCLLQSVAAVRCRPGSCL